MADDSTKPAAGTETPGAILKAAREKAGLSIDDLAGQLNLPAAKLRALEADRYGELPSEVFAQGYLRRYGKLVKVNDDMLVQRFNDYLVRTRATIKQVSREQERSLPAVARLPKWLIPALIFLAAVIVLVLVYTSTATDEAAGPVTSTDGAPADSTAIGGTAADSDAINDSAPTDRSPIDGEAPVDSATGDTAASDGPAGIDSAGEPRQLPGSDTITPPAAGTGAGSAASPTAQSTVHAPVGGREDRLAFTFSDKCWVEVTDANGATLHEGLANGGESLTVEGEAPFSIMLGNAAAVSLRYKGEPVPVTPRPGHRTAKLTVGE